MDLKTFIVALFLFITLLFLGIERHETNAKLDNIITNIGTAKIDTDLRYLREKTSNIYKDLNCEPQR